MHNDPILGLSSGYNDEGRTQQRFLNILPNHLSYLVRTDFISQLLGEQSISIRKQFRTSILRR